VYAFLTVIPQTSFHISRITKDLQQFTLHIGPCFFGDMFWVHGQSNCDFLFTCDDQIWSFYERWIIGL